MGTTLKRETRDRRGTTAWLRQGCADGAGRMKRWVCRYGRARVVCVTKREDGRARVLCFSKGVSSADRMLERGRRDGRSRFIFLVQASEDIVNRILSHDRSHRMARVLCATLGRG